MQQQQQQLPIVSMAQQVANTPVNMGQMVNPQVRGPSSWYKSHNSEVLTGPYIWTFFGSKKQQLQLAKILEFIKFLDFFNQKLVWFFLENIVF